MAAEKSSGATTIMARLKQDTQAYHAKLETLPYFNTLIAHSLPLESYVNQLRALGIVHSVMEHELAVSENREVRDVWGDGLRKQPLLDADLAFFSPRGGSDDPAVTEAALAMTEKIRLRGVEQPETLLGCLYVFEGSTLGNAMHRPDVSKTFHLSGRDGCRYYASYGDQVRARWTRFSDAMNRSLADTGLHESVLAAAHETFAGLEVLYTALYPLAQGDKPPHITRINPEAGNHPMPGDEREIRAALSASQQAWDFFSYYAQRYGERGKRFSDSDTCWLVTLSRLDPDIMEKQVDWLCRVLAARGMPGIMMEKTLAFLADALVGAVPENRSTYQKLMDAADRLEQARTAILPEEDCLRLARGFEDALPSGTARDWQHTGLVLVSAAIDEKNGIDGALDAFRKWATDPDRFSQQWIQAVHDTIQKIEDRLSLSES